MIQLVEGQKVESDHAWLSSVTERQPNPPLTPAELSLTLLSGMLPI